MQVQDIILIFIYILLLVVITPILGKFMYSVFCKEKNILTPPLGWLEKLIYKILKTDVTRDMNWKQYLFAVLVFNFFGFVLLYLLQVTQQWLPLNPQGLPNVSHHLAFNTAISFVTNTNWQSYAGETTLSYFVQMTGLTVQNFVSAGTGVAVLLALTRGIISKQSGNLGNFWGDLTKSVLYVLLPLAVIKAIFLISQGVVQNFNNYLTVTTLEGTKQILPMGPAASQTAIKMLGTNGGGFFNVNSAHPFENPTPFSNFLEMFSILMIPAALTNTYGKMVGSVKQGWVLFSAMMIIFIAALGFSLYTEFQPNSVMNNMLNMEGKEARFGITNSVIWSTATTSASNGSVNAMHSSLNPVASMIATVLIMLGEIVFGGVGSGMYGMLIFVFLTVFITGLMVGRTPEYLGKKVEVTEVKMTILGIIAPSFVILVFTAIALSTETGLSSIMNKGPHGLHEVLYAFTSAAGNNGSAFAGLNANTVFYNIMIGLGMIIGRFGVIIPVMVIAGSLAKKKISPVSSGTFTTDNYLFIVLLISVIIIVGALTFLPALSLGPIAEYISMLRGVTY